MGCDRLHRFSGFILICTICLGILHAWGHVWGDDPPLMDLPGVDPNIAEQMAEIDREAQDKKLESLRSAIQQGRESKDGAEVVRRGLADRDESVREVAVQGVLAIGGGLPDLLPYLNDKSDSVRLAAAREILAANGDVGVVLAVLFELREGEEFRDQVDDVFNGLHSKGIRRISDILIGQVRDENFLYRNQACDTLEHLGRLEPSILPRLRELLQDKREEVRMAGIKTLRGLGAQAQEALPDLRRMLKTENSDLQQQIAEAIGEIEPDYLPIVRGLIVRLEEEQGQTGPSKALAMDEKSPIPKEVIPGLMSALTDKDDDVREVSRKGLLAIGPEAGVGIIKELQLSHDPDLWREGCDLFKAMKVKSPGVLAGLTAGLRSEIPGVRIVAAKSLEEMGFEADEAAPGLLKMLDAKQEGVRAAGARGLGKIPSAATESIPRLTLLLKDESKLVRLGACQGLFRLKVKPEVFLPILSELMVEEENPQKRKEEPEVTEVRIPIEINEAGDAVPLSREGEIAAQEQLGIEMRGDDSPDFVSALINFVKETGKAGEILIPELIKGQGMKDLRDDGYGKRKICPLLPYAFKSIGSPSAIPVLLPAMKHPDPQVRYMAAKSLGRITPSIPEAVSALVAALRDEGSFKTSFLCGEVEHPVRSEAIVSLGRLGGEAASAVPELITRLGGQDESERQWVIRLLGKIGPPAREVVPILWKMRDDKSPVTRGEIFLAIARIAPDHAECLSAVIKSLEQVAQGELPNGIAEHNFVQICEAIALFGERAKSALPILERMIEEKQYLDRDSRCLAAGVVARVDRGNRTAMNFLKRMTQDENSVLYNWTARAQLVIIEGKKAEYDD